MLQKHRKAAVKLFLKRILSYSEFMRINYQNKYLKTMQNPYLRQIQSNRVRSPKNNRHLSKKNDHQLLYG